MVVMLSNGFLITCTNLVALPKLLHLAQQLRLSSYSPGGESTLFIPYNAKGCKATLVLSLYVIFVSGLLPAFSGDLFGIFKDEVSNLVLIKAIFEILEGIQFIRYTNLRVCIQERADNAVAAPGVADKKTVTLNGVHKSP